MNVQDKRIITWVLIKRYARFENWMPVKIIEKEDGDYFVPLRLQEFEALPVIVLSYFECDHVEEWEVGEFDYADTYLRNRSAARNEKNWKLLNELWQSSGASFTALVGDGGIL